MAIDKNKSSAAANSFAEGQKFQDELIKLMSKYSRIIEYTILVGIMQEALFRYQSGHIGSGGSGISGTVIAGDIKKMFEDLAKLRQKP